MSEASSPGQPIAIWNPARGVWETGRMSLLCEHSEPFLATWPASGMTRSGSAFERPTWEPPTPGSASLSSPGPDEMLMTPKGVDGDHPGVVTVKPGQQMHLSAQVGNLLPTPKVTDSVHSSPADANRHDPGLRAMHALLPTPDAYQGDRGGGRPPAERRAGGHSVSLQDVAEAGLGADPWAVLLPTPSVSDGLGGHLSRSGDRGEELLLPGIAKAVTEGDLLPTPRATDGTKGGPGQRGSSGDLMLPSAVQSLAPEVLLPTPNPFHLTNSEDPDEWLERRKEVQERTGTRHGPALPVVALSVEQGHPLYQGGKGPTRWSPGDPTSPPSDDGSDDWDE